MVYYSPIATFLDGYRYLFGISDFNLDLASIFSAAKNLLFGSMIFEIPTLIIAFETLVISYMIYQTKNTKVIFLMWFVGILIVGSISDNSGFLVRMRSPLILVTVLYFLFEKYYSMTKDNFKSMRPY